jgi:hypothetical protein
VRGVLGGGGGGGGGVGIIEFFLANGNKETSSQTFGVLDMRHTMT